MIEWTGQKDPDGFQMFSTDYKGFHLLAYESPVDGKWEGYMYSGNGRSRLIPTDDLEFMKEMLVSLADKEALIFRGIWHKYPEEKPEIGDGDLIVSVKDKKDGYSVTTLATWILDRFYFEGTPLYEDDDVFIEAWAELPRYEA